MASSTVIRAENVSKSFEIDEDRHSDATLRDAIAGGARAWVDAAASVVCRERPERPQKVTFWALRELSFAIGAGDVVGVIGRNGAGKSTLLKILSRITEPSAGRIGINGRVGSLLEVGTGFHPELTGRENVYLNGSILGMPRTEIRRRFDDIVEFAEIGPQPRHAGQAVLERHVGAARVRGRGPPGAGDPARRRGARRRRPGVPEDAASERWARSRARGGR